MSIAEHPTKNKNLPNGWKGKRWWYIIYYPLGREGGKAHLLYHGTRTEAEAEDLRRRKEKRKSAVVTTNPQIMVCLPDFMAWYALDRAPGTVEGAARHFRHICAYMGRLTLTGITPAIVDGYKRHRLDQGVKRATINNELAHINLLLSWAAENHLISEAMKCKSFPAKTTRSPVPSMPTRAEFEAIIAAVRPEVRGIAMLEFYAGLRRSEALNLAAENVFLDKGLLVVTGKGNKQRIVPVLHPALLAELAEKKAKVESGPLWINPVTGKPYRNVRDSLRAAARAAGVNMRIYPHLLRHGFGTTAIESGISQRTLQELMGHSDIQTTGIYTHLAATHLIEEMKKMSLDTVSKKSDGN